MLFLGTATFVTLIGLSALTGIRIKHRAASGDHDRVTARLYAQSAVEMALVTIYADPNWRDTIAPGAWQTRSSIGDGSFTWKIVDETNASFTTDRNAPVRVFGEGTSGGSVWIYSVVVQPPLESPPTQTDTLVNGDMESGILGWIGTQCNINSANDTAHGGLACLEVTDRDVTGGGPEQNVTGSIKNGVPYSVDLWVKLDDGPETVIATLWLQTSEGNRSIQVSRSVGTSWTRIGGLLTPTWTGTLISADLLVSTSTSTQGFRLDDVRMWEDQTARAREVGPLAGTWRRESN